MHSALSGLTRTARVLARIVLCGTVLVALLAWAHPSQADVCLQLNGGPFSGDLGFFRFKGSLPKAAGAIRALRGRVAGLSPVFGTATVAKDGSFLEVGAMFFADGTQGQFDVSFFPPRATSGGGYGDYGAYGTGESVTATIVSCATEP